MPPEPAPTAAPMAARAPRVLLCLADAAGADGLSRHLRAEGYAPEVVGAEGLPGAAGEGAPPAAVVLDGDVPALKDFAALKRLRTTPACARTLFVYGRRRVDIGYVLRAMDAGAAVFLFTPIDPVRLVKHLRDRIA